jgi:release factor glutamine methyltransferase
MRISITQRPSDVAGDIALNTALTGDIRAWRGYINAHSFRDGISVIERSQNHTVREALGAGDEGAWLNIMAGLQAHLGDGQRVHEWSKVEQVLFDTWDILVQRLRVQLARHARNIPTSGFVLYFTEYLDWCLVLRYELSGTAATVNLMHAIRHPEAVYDLYALLSVSTNALRTMMSNVMKSPAKLVGHRGTLVHVDRHTEGGVFGPSIDTLYLFEAVAQLVCERYGSQDSSLISTLLEPGTGSGFVTTATCTHVRSIKHVVLFDVNSQAVRCALKNLNAIPQGPGGIVHAICGEYYPELLSEKFDLVLVNPPYIPEPDGQHGIPDGIPSFTAAVSGTALLQMILSKSDSMLAPGGVLIMLYSQLAEEEFRAGLPDGMSAIPLVDEGGLEVLFDVEDVFERPGWLEYLKDERQLVLDADSNMYSHRVLVKAVTRTKDLQSPIPGSLAERLKRAINTKWT